MSNIGEPSPETRQHRERINKLVERVRAYGKQAGLAESTLSRKVLNDTKELERLANSGKCHPETLDQHEQRLSDLMNETAA
ncbi:MAG: hypothetical protein AAGA72_18310 [Pseudomonadota bacterium]